VDREIRSMKLGHWIKKEKLTLEAFGERIDSHVSSVQRYVTDERVPGKKTMVRIYVETRGEVQPNDFFDLPDLAELVSQSTSDDLADLVPQSTSDDLVAA
jgi:hypothetical protein